MLSAMSVAAALTCAAACANDKATPLSPETVAATETGAAADGSTLKVTAPGPVSPVSGAEVNDSSPPFTVTNSQARFGPTPPLVYRFEVQKENGEPVQSGLNAAGDGRTSWEPPRALEQGTFRWRTRAEMEGRHGPWSEFVTFKMVAPPSLLPPGPYPREPFEIAKFVERSYPERTRRGVSLSKRKENMAFLRDRLIEVGLCVGLEMGRNLKRGGPEHSYDFIAYKTGGKTWGVDIAGGYDDTSETLKLGFHMHAPRAFFDPLPNPEPCLN
jgi:hypothetical protein